MIAAAFVQLALHSHTSQHTARAVIHAHHLPVSCSTADITSTPSITREQRCSTRPLPLSPPLLGFISCNVVRPAPRPLHSPGACFCCVSHGSSLVRCLHSGAPRQHQPRSVRQGVPAVQPVHQSSRQTHRTHRRTLHATPPHETALSAASHCLAHHTYCARLV